ncbi:MlaE family ABC transporter permease [Piscinibacter sakaiensis]|uniref:MlaE family ABC transporter permease n=1 Tax=Piscinibacter sakaiensis TaxID=1547922 RepID=UPI003AAB9161
MSTSPPARRQPVPKRFDVAGLTLGRWLLGWWYVLRFGARVLVLAASPSTYRRCQRRLILHNVYLATWPMLPGFALLTAIFGLVVIRIVLTTALTYGLTQYALDVLVRTLVLELIPLSAALYVAVRYSLAEGEMIRMLRAEGRFKEMLRAGRDPTRDIVLPKVIAGQFAVVSLTVVSGVVVLLLTYLSLYGFATWGLEGFTRGVGQVLDPLTILILLMKTFFMSLAVALIPMVTTALDVAQGGSRAHAELVRLARLLTVMLLIEIAALVGSYY